MNTWIRLLVVGMVLGAAVAPPTWAQSSTVQVSAEASSTEIGAQESVVLIVRVEGRQASRIETPDPPVTTNLVLEQPTPTTQRNVSINGQGQMEQSVTYRWLYEPVRTGSAEIGPVEVTVAGSTYTTDPIRVRILPQAQRPSLPSTAPHGARPSPQPPASRPRGDGVDARDLFIRAEPSATRVFQNEQVTIEYRLFFRPNVQLRRSRLASAWDANGFWREELDVASRPRPRTRRMNGRAYRSIVLKRVAVFPTRPGTLRVDPLRIETEAYTTAPHRRPMQRGFEPTTIASDALTIEARSLPTDAPPRFQGAVGDYALRTRLSADSVQVGDAVRLHVTVEGRGNLATLSPPAFSPPAAFASYAPETATDINRSGRVVRGTKTFTYTLIPQSGGRYTLPAVELPVFDPGARTYETLRSDSQTLHVTGDAAPAAVSTTGSGLPVGDITPLMTESHWMRTDAVPLHRQAWIYAVMLLTLLLGAGGIAYRRAGAVPLPFRSDGDAASSSQPAPAMASAERQLGKADQALRNGETKRFYRKIEQALIGFLRTRTGTLEPGASREAVAALLEAHPVPPADCEALDDLLDVCEEAQFTPENPAYDRAASDLTRARRLLQRLDGALPAHAVANHDAPPS
jgi:hypothetical protein